MIDDWKDDPETECPVCKRHAVKYRTVEDDEGHEDYKFKCTCGHHWRVDGADS